MFSPVSCVFRLRWYIIKVNILGLFVSPLNIVDFSRGVCVRWHDDELRALKRAPR